MKHASVDKAKRVSSSCRNNGSCPYCRRSRTMSAAREHIKALEQDAERMRGVLADVVQMADEVLLDPEGLVSIAGSDEDCRIVQAAIDAARVQATAQLAQVEEVRRQLAATRDFLLGQG